MHDPRPLQPISQYSSLFPHYTVQSYPRFPSRVSQRLLYGKFHNCIYVPSPANWTWKLKKKLVKCYILSTVLWGAETGHFGKKIRNTWKFCSVVLENDGKHQLDRSCEKWRSITKSKGGKNLQAINRRKVNWIGYIFRMTCFLNHVTEEKIEGRIEVTGRRWIRRKQLLDYLKWARGYWKLKGEALARTVWRTRYSRGYVSGSSVWSAHALDPSPISKVSVGTFF